MAETVIMPKLGFDMAEGTLVRWVKKPGDEVAKGDVLAEIETDKATVEVESPFSGIVARQLVEQGSVVPVGDPIAIVGAPGEDAGKIETQGGKQATPEQKPPQPVDQQPEPVAQKESLGESAQPSDERQPVEAEPASQGKTESQAPVSQGATGVAEPGQAGEAKFASPLARKIAQERGIDLSNVSGSGPGGRIVRKDLDNLPASAVSETRPASSQGKAPASHGEKISTPASEKPQNPPAVWLPALGAQAPADQQVPFSRLRQAIGRRMLQSSQQIPSFYVTREYRVDQLAALREQVNAALPQGEKLSYNDFIVKAVALTLRQYPNLNSSLQGDGVVQHGHINIGVAVAVEGGLLTVVCTDADLKPLRVISSELNTMISRVTSGKVRPEDIEGSTFSTSNLGMFGVEDFVAIINPPEAAILAIGAVKAVPVVQDGEVIIGQLMKATISADHRISDGAEAARFMHSLAGYLENPTLLLL